MRVLVFGANGMIGHAMFRILSQHKDLDVLGTVRSMHAKRFFSEDLAKNLIGNVDVGNQDVVLQVVDDLRPDVVINCVGITKHVDSSKDPIASIAINALLPHRLAKVCDAINARFIHISTDCIFSGKTGSYVEDSPSDAEDLYGKSKFLGEVSGPRVLTLRTSTIGHELETSLGLLEWFLSQNSACSGYTRAIFSGLPNTVFAEVVRDHVISKPDLCGLYHLGAGAIGKYELLRLIARIYGKSISITPDDNFVMDRSFNSDRFKEATGYIAPTWTELIQSMHSSR
jgi:dTDP-4-dehydrorhamnose reductase